MKDVVIDDYEFGKITINSKSYEKDLKILQSGVKPNWWRKEGHSLCKEDIEDVLQEKPTVFIIGCGANGCLKVPEILIKELNRMGIQVFAESTKTAVDRYNQMKDDPTVSAAFHLTC